MKENLFEMGANFSDEWTSDNKNKKKDKVSQETKEPEQHHLYFAREKRRGKVVSIVKEFYLKSNDLKSLLKVLKKKLGTGGTVRENSLEFQGEVQEQLKRELQNLGYGMK